MRKVNEIRSLIGDKVNEIDALFGVAETEKRTALTPEEQTKLDGLIAERKALETELDNAIVFENNTAMRNAKSIFVNGTGTAKEDKDIQKYDLFTAIRMKAENQPLTGIYAEMHEEAKNELRGTDQTITGFGVPSFLNESIQERANHTATGGATEGKSTIVFEQKGFIDQLWDQTYLKEAGATFIRNCKGNIQYMRQLNKVSVQSVAENAAAAASQLAWDVLNILPARNSANLPLSKMLLIQSNLDVQADALRYLNVQHAEKVEVDAMTAILAAAVEVNLSGANGQTFDYANLLEVQRLLTINKLNSKNVKWLTNQNIKKKALLTPELANTIALPVWKDNMMAGVPAISTNFVPSNLVKGASGATLSTSILGDFSYLKVCQWGTLDITVDPYTGAKTGLIEITADTFFGYGATRVEAFLRTDKTITV